MAEVAQAHARGMRVMLKPHLWVRGGEWCGHIDPGTAAGRRRWLRSYELFITRYAALAQRAGIDALAIGTELSTMVADRDLAPDWRRVIAAVRKGYTGPITYAANWNVADRVPFWPLVDFIGVQAYAPLVKRRGAPEAELRAGARRMADALAGLARRYDRRVVLTEIGYRSIRDPALKPNLWPEHDPHAVYDEAAQALAYRAVYDALIDRPWFAGLFWWKWFSDPDQAEDGRVGFVPKAKAQAVMRTLFRAHSTACGPR